MEYILFTKEGKYLGLRGSEPKKEENLIYFEWYKEFEQITEPTLKEDKIVSGEVVYTLEQINQMQFEELSKTDWAYIRERELNIDVPIEIVEERKAIREKYNNLKQLLITIDLNDEQGTI
jgi:hypothetical protein